jgi:YegS/Rv2252/BmrU family lipid kinase
MTPTPLLINPAAGLLRGCTTVSEIKPHLPGLDMDVELHQATDTAGILRFCNYVKHHQPPLILVAGGDGTIATVLKSLIKMDITIGLIPTGSMNNIARSINLPDSIAECIKVIYRGNTKLVDAGQASGQIFFESVGVGFLAQVMERVGEQDSKKELLKVARHTIAEMINCEPFKVKLTVDGKVHHIDTLWLTITNTGRAGAVEIDPAAQISDGQLEITYTKVLSATELPRSVISFLRNNHIKQRHFIRLRGAEIRLELDSPRAIHIDGELIEQQSINVRVLPQASRLIVP